MSPTADPTLVLPEDLVPTEGKTTVVEADDIDLPKPHDGPLDDIEIQVAHREWVIEGDFTVLKRDGTTVTEQFKRTYVQKPLSFTSMLQFTGLIGEKISEAMSGPDGISLDGVLAESDGLVSAGRALLTSSDFAGVDSFVKGFAKLASHVPEVIEDCQCIWLRVPHAERPIVKEIWSRSPDEGGLRFEEGQEMLETFLSQNYDEVEDFFVVRLKHLVGLVKKLRTRKSSGDRRLPSKRSSTSQADTPSQ